MTSVVQANDSLKYGRYYHEPLYAGNLSMRSSRRDGNPFLYRWILFVSASNTEITCSETIKSVEYKFKNVSEIKSTPPFFLESGSSGIFQFFVIIRFKDKYHRSDIELPYILSLNSATTVLDITQTTSRQYFTTLFDYKKFNEFKAEANEMASSKIKNSFVQHIGRRLTQNLKRLPSPLRFVNFAMKLPQFTSMLLTVISSIDTLNALQIPSSIYNEIGLFVVFHASHPINDLLPAQRCIINECNTCDIHISSLKFKNLLVKSSRNLSITFPCVLSQCELHQCHNVTIVCTNILYSYRLDGCSNINIIFNDTPQRVTFLCFDSTNVTLTVKNIKYHMLEDEDQDDEKHYRYLKYSETDRTKTFHVGTLYSDAQRLNVRWRSAEDEPQFTSRVFHPRQTIGSVR